MLAQPLVHIKIGLAVLNQPQAVFFLELILCMN